MKTIDFFKCKLILTFIIELMKGSLLIISIMLAGFVSGTLYSVSPDFTISYQQQGNELAHAYYDLKTNSQGWNYLNVYANGQKTLLQQHRGAGFLQGYVSYKEIYYAYINYNKQLLNGQPLNAKVQSFVNQQLDHIQAMIQGHPKQLYWQYAEAYLEQLRYMYRGFLTRLHTENRLDLYIGFSQFYTLTNVGDLQDLIPAFSSQPQTVQKQGKNLQAEMLGNCNGFVKLINQTIFAGHSTHNHYSFLLRIYKSYNFPSRNSLVGSQTLSFSSRPGDLISKDDFYVLSSGLKVMESSLSNFNTNNYKDLSPLTVPTWLRQTIACNLARTSTQWVDYFLKERSGTHNNQWVIVDEKMLSSKKNAIVFVQDGFSQFQVLDMTQRFLLQGYIATYNVPVSQKIYKKLGFQKYPYDYDHDPRAETYKKYNASMLNQQDMKKWLLTNQYEDVTVGLAPRYDLSDDPNKKRPFGLTDCKLVSGNTLNDNFIWAYSGPTKSNGRFAPFNWSNWPNVSHLGMPSQYNFQWIKFYIVYQDENYKKERQVEVEQ